MVTRAGRGRGSLVTPVRGRGGATGIPCRGPALPGDLAGSRRNPGAPPTGPHAFLTADTPDQTDVLSTLETFREEILATVTQGKA